MSIIGLIVSILLPTGIGYLIIQLAYSKNSQERLASLALGFGLGMGILTQYMLLLGILNVSYTASIIGLPLTLLLVILLFFYYKINHKAKDGKTLAEMYSSKKAASQGLNFLNTLLLVYILINVFFVFWRALNVPIISWDALSSVAFKAKVIYYERSLDNLANLPHAAYPLYIPFLQTWLALLNQGWHDQIIKIIFPLVYISFITCYYYFLKLYTSKRWSLIGCVLLVSSNLFTFHATTAYRDLFLLYYTCVSIMLLLIWNKKREGVFLILSALFAGFATFVKVEGNLYLAVHYTLLLFLIWKQKQKKLLTYTQPTSQNHTDNVGRYTGNHKKRLHLRKAAKHFLTFIVPSMCITLIYQIYRISNHINFEEKAQIEIGWQQLGRIPEVLNKFLFDLYWTGNWGVVWLLLTICLFRIKLIRDRVENQFLLLALILFFLLISAVSIFSASFIWISGEFSSTGLSRLILHFFPLAVLLIILINAPRIES